MSADAEPLAPASSAPIRVTCPADLVGAVPYLVGFTPRRSLVVISLREPRLHCGLVARADLPEQVADVGPLAGELAAQLLADQPVEVALLVYDGVPWRPAARPWQELVDAVERALAREGVRVREACFVGEQAFWSYRCWDPGCCPDQGTPLVEAASAPAAAALVVAGRAPACDREDLRRLVAAGRPDVTAAVAGLAERCWADLVDGDPEAGREQVVRLFGELVDRHTDPRRVVRSGNDSEVAQLVAGLADTTIRDEVAMRWVSWLAEGPDAQPSGTPIGMTALPPTHDAVTSVLLELARFSDGEWAVGPLTLYALQCWQAGDGALANLAIERALLLDPDYRMALLVEAVLRAGIAPRRQP
jgi:hypothetical protein